MIKSTVFGLLVVALLAGCASSSSESAAQSGSDVTETTPDPLAGIEPYAVDTTVKEYSGGVMRVSTAGSDYVEGDAFTAHDPFVGDGHHDAVRQSISGALDIRFGHGDSQMKVEVGTYDCSKGEAQIAKIDPPAAGSTADVVHAAASCLLAIETVSAGPSDALTRVTGRFVADANPATGFAATKGAFVVDFWQE